MIMMVMIMMMIDHDNNHDDNDNDDDLMFTIMLNADTTQQSKTLQAELHRSPHKMLKD